MPARLAEREDENQALLTVLQPIPSAREGKGSWLRHV